MDKSTREGQSSNTMGKWEGAISAAISALQDFRKAEMKRQAQLTDEANSIVEDAVISLKCRYEIPIFSSIISNYLLFNIVWMKFQFFTNQS